MEYLIAKDFNEHRRVAKCENIYHILPLWSECVLHWNASIPLSLRKRYLDLHWQRRPVKCTWSNIPSAPVCRVAVSRLIRYSRACGSDHYCLDRGLLLTRKLLNQGFLVVLLKSSHRMLYSHNRNLVNIYTVSVSQMNTDMHRLSLSQSGPFLIHNVFVKRVTRQVPLVE